MEISINGNYSRVDNSKILDVITIDDGDIIIPDGYSIRQSGDDAVITAPDGETLHIVIASTDEVESIKLTKGIRYDTARLQWSGWSGIDDYSGYNIWDYFENDGTYKGADEEGTEPMFWSQSVLEQ